jgi:hypothetical protein
MPGRNNVLKIESHRRSLRPPFARPIPDFLVFQQSAASLPLDLRDVSFYTNYCSWDWWDQPIGRSGCVILVHESGIVFLLENVFAESPQWFDPNITEPKLLSGPTSGRCGREEILKIQVISPANMYQTLTSPESVGGVSVGTTCVTWCRRVGILDIMVYRIESEFMEGRQNTQTIQIQNTQKIFIPSTDC